MRSRKEAQMLPINGKGTHSFEDRECFFRKVLNDINLSLGSTIQPGPSMSRLFQKHEAAYQDPCLAIFFNRDLSTFSRHLEAEQ